MEIKVELNIPADFEIELSSTFLVELSRQFRVEHSYTEFLELSNCSLTTDVVLRFSEVIGKNGSMKSTSRKAGNEAYNHTFQLPEN